MLTIISPSSPSFSPTFSDLQYLPRNRHSVFQVISNFNTLIHSVDFFPGQKSKRHTDEDEEGEDDSEEVGSVGNEFCAEFFRKCLEENQIGALSVGGAALTRIFAPFHNPQVDEQEWGQTEKKQVNVFSFSQN